MIINNKNMEELKVKANSYIEDNVINVLKEAFAKVYADGYRQGYKDCKEDIPVDLRSDNTEFIDLGLPSGTLWSSSYEKIGEERLYLPYDKAKEMNIPTENQWMELRKECRWSIDSDKLYCIGPNGNSIHFRFKQEFYCNYSLSVFFCSQQLCIPITAIIINKITCNRIKIKLTSSYTYKRSIIPLSLIDFYRV